MSNEQVPSDALFRFHWLDGRISEGRGRDAAEAINRLGFGRGALRALDYWELVSGPGNDALPGERVAAQGGTLLSQLRHDCEHADCVTVDTPVLLALIEIVEAATRFKTARIGEMSIALQALDAALTKLEPL